MGGYFIGRPMDPESRPAKSKKAKAESRVKSHGLGWRQADQGPCGEKDPPGRKGKRCSHSDDEANSSIVAGEMSA